MRRTGIGLALSCLLCVATGCATPSRTDAGPAGAPASGEPFIIRPDGSIERVGPGRPGRSAVLQSATRKSVAGGPISWQVQYDDVLAGSGYGFDDPAEGAARREAFEDSLVYVGEVLNPARPSVIDVRVEPSTSLSTGELAHASTIFAPVAAGITPGYAARHIQTGNDPDPALTDVLVTFNFNAAFHTGRENPPPTLTDMRSVAVHEVTHALGMLSLLGADGRSTASGSNPGQFSTFDALLGRAGGTALVNAGARFLGTPQDLVGQGGGELTWLGPRAAAALGRAPRLHTPPVFEPTSSISHWSLRDPSAVMQPSIPRGVRRRNYAPVEEGMLRDLGYVGARLPTSRLLAFAPAKAYPAGGVVQATVVQEFDSAPGPDLLVLEPRLSGGSLLRVYSNLGAGTPYTYVLPQLFTRMSAATVGRGLRGVVLGSVTQETLLSLGGLRLPADRVALRASDFAHVHAAYGPASNDSGGLVLDPSVTAGDVDGDGLDDFVTVSRRHGLLTFSNDGFGDFDRLGSARREASLGPTVNVALDLSASDTNGPLTADVPFDPPPGQVNLARTVVGSGQTTFHRGLNPVPGYRVHVLARYGPWAIAGLQSVSAGRQELARLAFDANGDYRIVDRWAEVSEVRDIAIVRDPDEAIFTTGSGHTIGRLPLSGSVTQRLAGSVKGYRNGPADQALFDTPTSLCVSGRSVYVVDSGNAVIRRIDLVTRTVETVTGRPGVHVYNDGPRGTASFALNPPQSTGDACAVIGDSLFVWDAVGPQGPEGLRKVNLNNGYVLTVPSEHLGPHQWGRALNAVGHKLLYLQGVFNQTTVESVSMFATRQNRVQGAIVRLHDMDGDGKQDAMVLLEPQFRSLNYYRSLGPEGFQYVSQVVFDAPPLNVEILDANGDGHPDIVATFPRAVRTFLGDGASSWEEDPTRRLMLATTAVWSELRDVTQDGRADLAVLDATGRLLVFVTDEAGRWGAGSGDSGEDYVTQLDVGPSPSWFTFVTANADLLPDLLTRGSASQEVRLHLGQRPTPAPASASDRRKPPASRR